MCQHLVSAMLLLPINQTGRNVLSRTICCGENHSTDPFCVPTLFYFNVNLLPSTLFYTC